MEKIIVVINGTARSGKDSFVSFVSKYKRVLNFSSIDKVKEVAKIIGWTGAKEEKDRKFLSDLKKLTTEYNDMAFNSIKAEIEKFKSSSDEIMFIHIREPEEIERVVKEFGAKTLLIKREGLDFVFNNDSDKNVENYNYDFVIYNSTLEKLDKDALSFANTVI